MKTGGGRWTESVNENGKKSSFFNNSIRKTKTVDDEGIYVYIYIFIYLYIYLCINIQMYVFTYAYIYTCKHI
jgi:hypothetical protein